jgi:hypothetical protein
VVFWIWTVKMQNEFLGMDEKRTNFSGFSKDLLKVENQAKNILIFTSWKNLRVWPKNLSHKKIPLGYQRIFEKFLNFPLGE